MSSKETNKVSLMQHTLCFTASTRRLEQRCYNVSFTEIAEKQSVGVYFWQHGTVFWVPN